MTRAIEDLKQAMEVCELGALTWPDQVDALMDAARGILQEISAFTSPNEWVSVDERMPETEKEVRLFCITSNGYKYQCQGFYVPPGMHRDDSDYSWDWECCEQYDEDSDDYFVNPGWYESCHNWDEYSAFGIPDKVTHWMPLPSPPEKEE